MLSLDNKKKKFISFSNVPLRPSGPVLVRKSGSEIAVASFFGPSYFLRISTSSFFQLSRTHRRWSSSYAHHPRRTVADLLRGGIDAAVPWQMSEVKFLIWKHIFASLRLVESAVIWYFLFWLKRNSEGRHVGDGPGAIHRRESRSRLAVGLHGKINDEIIDLSFLLPSMCINSALSRIIIKRLIMQSGGRCNVSLLSSLFQDEMCSLVTRCDWWCVHGKTREFTLIKTNTIGW